MRIERGFRVMVSRASNSSYLSSYGHFCMRFGHFLSPAPNAQFLQFMITATLQKPYNYCAVLHLLVTATLTATRETQSTLGGKTTLGAPPTLLIHKILVRTPYASHVWGINQTGLGKDLSLRPHLIIFCVHLYGSLN